jgi:uncharacterized membrane protein YbhN (UPF0104 family)
MGRKVLGSLITVLLIVLCLSLLLSAEDIKRLVSLPLRTSSFLVFVTYIVYLISGVELAIIAKQTSDIKLSLKDILLLPITMNLWSFLIPFQGAVIYLALLFRYKYKSAVADAFSVSLFSYLLSFTLTGICGSIFFSLGTTRSSLFLLFSLLMAVTPITLLGAHYYSTPLKKIKLPFTDFGWRILDHLRRLILQYRLVVAILCTNLVHLAASYEMHALAASALGFSISPVELLLFTLVMRLTIIVKITPGNVGIQEILSGGVFSALHLDPAQGVLILMLTRITSLLLMGTLGVVDSLVNTKHFTLGTIWKQRQPA